MVYELSTVKRGRYNVMQIKRNKLTVVQVYILVIFYIMFY